MSLEESLTIFVTHFINYSGLVHCTSGQTKGFFSCGRGGGAVYCVKEDEQLAVMPTAGKKRKRRGADKLKEKLRHTVSYFVINSVNLIGSFTVVPVLIRLCTTRPWWTNSYFTKNQKAEINKEGAPTGRKRHRERVVQAPLSPFTLSPLKT